MEKMTPGSVWTAGWPKPSPSSRPPWPRSISTAEEMVGKKVMVLVNLKPAKLAGVLSEGMLLCAEDAEGNLSLMTPEKEMPSGAEIC